jgi:pyruvate formate lyase activating enzyme
LENYRYLAGNGAGITVRMPLIPSINDGEDDLKQARDFFLELSPRTRIDLLPYHRLGVTKYERLGLAYPLTGLEPPGAESIRRIKTFFEEAGFTTTIGG